MDILNYGLKLYVIQNNLGAYINFKESPISENPNSKYQILVLEKPTDMLSELMDLTWSFKTEKVLLIYDCTSTKVIYVPLEFSFRLPATVESEIFNLSYFDQIKRCGDQIMLIQNGYYKKKSEDRFLAIAIFSLTGELLSFWEAEYRYDEPKINFFKDLGGGRWLIKFELKEFKEILFLLTKGRLKEWDLSIQTEKRFDTGTLLKAKTDEINVWFSDEAFSAKFFVLASHYQFCAYSLQNHSNDWVYERMSNIVMPTHIEKFDVVAKQDSFVINFEINSTWSGDSKFSLLFKPEGGKNE